MKVRMLGFIAALTVGGVMTVALAGEAQAGKVPRIALVVNTPEADVVGSVPRDRGARAFLEGLRELGWVDGQNIQIERRSMAGQPDRAKPLLQEIVRLQVDAIVTAGGTRVRAAKQATETIPQ